MKAIAVAILWHAIITRSDKPDHSKFSTTEKLAFVMGRLMFVGLFYWFLYTGQ